MKYQGSKNRHAKQILPIILKDRKKGQYFYDLFAGGFNLIDKVDSPRVGNEINRYLISLVKKLQEGWLPDEEITKEQYLEIKNNQDKYSDYLLGYVGYQLTFSSQWFGSYRRDNIGKRNYSLEAYNNIKKQAPKLKDIELYNLSYDEVPLQPNSIIYLDPPYRNTSGYETTKEGFDYNKFYQWCIEKHKEGHKVFISEYWMPEENFKCIWEKKVNSSLDKNTGGKSATEKLWVVK